MTTLEDVSFSIKGEMSQHLQLTLEWFRNNTEDAGHGGRSNGKRDAKDCKETCPAVVLVLGTEPLEPLHAGQILFH